VSILAFHTQHPSKYVFRLNHELNKTFLKSKVNLLPNMSILVFHTWHPSMHLWPKNNIQHFLWMNEDRNPNAICSSWCCNYCASRTLKVQLLIFLFLVSFVVLQVIVEWLRWVSLSDGTRSLLFNWKKLWGMWVMVLGKDWRRTFKRMKGGGQKATIWSWLKKRSGGQFFFFWE